MGEDGEHSLPAFNDGSKPDVSEILRFSERGRQRCKDVLHIFKKRLAIETDYSKQLERLYGSVAADGKGGRRELPAYTDMVIEELQSTHKLHAAFVACLSKKLIPHLSDAINYDAKVDTARKQFLEEYHALERDIQVECEALKKAKDSHEKLLKGLAQGSETHAAAVRNPSVVGKKMAKVQQRYDDDVAREEVARDTVERVGLVVAKKQDELVRIHAPRIYENLQQYEDARALVMSECCKTLNENVQKASEQYGRLHRCFKETLNAPGFFRHDTKLFLSGTAGGLDENMSVAALYSATRRSRLFVAVAPVGQLHYTGPNAAKFKERFCVLVDRMFYWFAHEASTSPKGRICLPFSDRAVRPIGPSFSSHELCFELTDGRTTVAVYCEDEETYVTWLSDLNEVASMSPTGEVDTMTMTTARTLEIVIESARNLPNDRYYCEVYLDGLEGQARTPRSEGAKPVWNSGFFLEDLPPSVEFVTIVVLREKRHQPIYKCDLYTSSLRPGTRLSDWVVLESPSTQPEGTQRRSINFANDVEEDTPAIKIRARTTVDVVKPLEEYQPMADLLLGDSSFINSFVDALPHEQRETVAKHLIYLAHGRGAGVFHLITNLARREIDECVDPATLFRGNSLATKVIDTFIKMIGLPYLRATLEFLVNTVADSKAVCEVDPNRGGGNAAAWKTLLRHMNALWQEIDASVDDCPMALRCVFRTLRSMVVTKWGNAAKSKHTVVSGFIFLRFFCPALMSPKSFGLVEDTPSPTASRTLTLLAKSLQNLANLVEFGGKEEYMVKMNDFISETRDQMIRVLDLFSTPAVHESDVDIPLAAVECEPFRMARHAAAIHTVLVEHEGALLDSLPAAASRQLQNLMDTLRGCRQSIALPPAVQRHLSRKSTIKKDSLLLPLEMPRRPRTIIPAPTSQTDADGAKDSEGPSSAEKEYLSLEASADAPALSPRKSEEIWVAMYDYEKKHADELSLKKGDQIKILEIQSKAGDEWMVGELNGVQGLFPGNFAQPKSISAAPASPSRVLRPRADVGASSEVVVEGYLHKHPGRGKLSGWKKRWMKLRGTTLAWYKDEHDALPAGTLDMELVARVSAEVVDSCPNKDAKDFGLAVHVPSQGRAVLLSAPSKEDQVRWLRALGESLLSTSGPRR